MGTKKRFKRFCALLLLLIAVSALKSIPQLGYTTWLPDEQYVVVRALGFLEFDFDPHWYKYQTLPTYITGAWFFVSNFFSNLSGATDGTVDFVSGLYSHEAFYYISTRLLFSFAYTLGTFILSWILYTYYRSKAAAIACFVVCNLLSDALSASNAIRTDTMFFLFTSATIYFACFTKVSLRNLALAALCCAAAFASKFPAVTLIPILLAKVFYEVFRKNICWRDSVIIAALIPAGVFCFMPYSFLNFELYKPLIQSVFKTATTPGYYSFGFEERQGPLAKFLHPWLLLLKHTGVVAFALFIFQGVLSLYKDRDLIFPYCFAGATYMGFATSSHLADYWMRPSFPLVVFFAFVCLVNISRRTPRLRADTPWGKALWPLACVVFLATMSHEEYRSQLSQLQQKGEDTRVVASRWIQQHIPPGSNITLDGHVRKYLPKVYSYDPKIDKHLFHNYLIDRSYVLEKAFVRHLANLAKDHEGYQVTYIDPSTHMTTWDIRHVVLEPGDHIVIASPVYERFARASTRAQVPELSRKALAFYAFLETQDVLHVFEGVGPTIKVIRMKDGLDVFRDTSS